MLIHSPRTTLHIKIICNVVLICVGQYCARNLPVQCWPIVNEQLFLKHKLYNIVSTKLGQHCTGISYTQCCPNISETTLHMKITCAILALSAHQCFFRKIAYANLSWSAWANIAQNNYLYNADNVDPQSTVYSMLSKYG